MKRARCALLLAAALLLSACGRTAADASVPAPAAAATLPAAPVPATPTLWEEVPVYADGLLFDRAFRNGDTVCVSVSALCDRFGLEAALSAEGGGCQLALPGVTLRCTAGREYAEADGRYLYTPGGFLLQDGELYLPAQAAAHLFGITAAVTEDPPRVDLDTDRFRLLTGGTDYYSMHFPVEDLYWLSHIIYSESHLQPLAGQIGVGNVVLNRVASPLYPDSIMAVVLERSETAVQFDPTADGSVHAPVDEAAMIAACLCLEGYNTVGDSMFFVNPDRGDSSWFEAERQFVVRIGEHNFYT